MSHELKKRGVFHRKEVRGTTAIYIYIYLYSLLRSLHTLLRKQKIEAEKLRKISWEICPGIQNKPKQITKHLTRRSGFPKFPKIQNDLGVVPMNWFIGTTPGVVLKFWKYRPPGQMFCDLFWTPGQICLDPGDVFGVFGFFF